MAGKLKFVSNLAAEAARKVTDDMRITGTRANVNAVRNRCF